MKIKIFVGIAIIIFILTVGNIIAFGLLQPVNDFTNDSLKNLPDYNAVVDSNKNKIVQPTVENTTNKTTSTTTQNNPNTAVTPTPTPKKKTPTPKTRAS